MLVIMHACTLDCKNGIIILRYNNFIQTESWKNNMEDLNELLEGAHSEVCLCVGVHTSGLHTYDHTYTL